MRQLLYPDIITTLDNKELEISVNSNVLSKITNINDIMTMDYEIRNRCLNNLDNVSNFNSLFNLHLHSYLNLNMLNSINGKLHIAKDKIYEIEFIEDIKTSNNFIFGLFELTPDMINAGFKIISNNFKSLNSLDKSILIVNTKHRNSYLDNDLHIINLKIFG